MSDRNPDLRAVHRRVQGDGYSCCESCVCEDQWHNGSDFDWPCDTIRVLDDADRLADALRTLPWLNGPNLGWWSDVAEPALRQHDALLGRKV